MEEMNRLEPACLHELEWNLYVKPVEFAAVVSELERVWRGEAAGYDDTCQKTVHAALQCC